MVVVMSTKSFHLFDASRVERSLAMRQPGAHTFAQVAAQRWQVILPAQNAKDAVSQQASWPKNVTTSK